MASVAVSAGGGRLVCGFDADPSVPPRRQSPYCPHFSFSYVFRGTGKLTDESGSSFGVRPGSVVLRFAGRRQDFVFAPKPRYAKAYVCLDPSVAHAFVALGLVDPSRPVVYVPEDDDILERWLRLRALCENSGPESFFAVFIETQRLLASLLGRGEQELVSDEGAPWMAEACRMLASDRADRLPTASVAQILGVDYHTFRRIFRKVKGLPPGEYRIRRRLDRACSLLAKYNVSETGYRLGYVTPCAFSAQFTRFVGQSPKDYRKAVGG